MAPIFELIFILMMIVFAYYLTRHRLGYFRTHERLGEVGSDPPPFLLSQKPMVVSCPARRSSKAFYEISPKHT